MSQVWEQMKKEVAMKLRRERAEVDANKIPKAVMGLRSVFPVKERLMGSMEFRTIDMKLDSTWYRLVLDRMRDNPHDQEGVLTLQLWRESPCLHRQVAVIGEIHRFIVSWDGVIVDLNVVSVPGEEHNLMKYPSVFKVGPKRKAFTINSFPVDLLRLMGREQVVGIPIAKRFIFMVLGAKEVVGQTTVENFVSCHSGRDILNLLNYLEVGAQFTRPTVEEAGLENLEIQGQSQAQGQQMPPPPGPPGPRVVRHDVDVTNNGRKKGEAAARQQRTNTAKAAADVRITRRSLWTENSARAATSEEEDAESSGSVQEEDSPNRTRTRAVFTLNGGRDWRNFQPKDYKFAIRRRRQLGDNSLPMDYVEDREEDGSLNESVRANSSLETSGAGVSPRGELSQNSGASSDLQVSMVDLTGASSEEDRAPTLFSPFLAKKPRKVMTLGSTSSGDVLMETQDTSVQEINPGNDKSVEAEKEKVGGTEKLDDSVICEEGEPGNLDEEKC